MLLAVVWLRQYPTQEVPGFLLGASDSTALRAVRPGEQVSLGINPSFIPTSPTLGVPFGPRVPGFAFSTTDFYAHGASVGLAFTY